MGLMQRVAYIIYSLINIIIYNLLKVEYIIVLRALKSWLKQRTDWEIRNMWYLNYRFFEREVGITTAMIRIKETNLVKANQI